MKAGVKFTPLTPPEKTTFKKSSLITVKGDYIKEQLSILDLLNHEETMGFHSRSNEILIHLVFFSQNIF